MELGEDIESDIQDLMRGLKEIEEEYMRLRDENEELRENFGRGRDKSKFSSRDIAPQFTKMAGNVRKRNK